MRCMSFAATTEQIKNRTKTVTRRMGWKFLKRGDRLEAVEKYRGVLRSKRKSLGQIIITSVRREKLNKVTYSDCVKEGFPDFSPYLFIEFFCKMNRCQSSQRVTVIRFRYV